MFPVDAGADALSTVQNSAYISCASRGDPGEGPMIAKACGAAGAIRREPLFAVLVRIMDGKW